MRDGMFAWRRAPSPLVDAIAAGDRARHGLRTVLTGPCGSLAQEGSDPFEGEPAGLGVEIELVLVAGRRLVLRREEERLDGNPLVA
jgi:hypothetical protein